MRLRSLAVTTVVALALTPLAACGGDEAVVPRTR